jgi:glucose/arabinose dehydrogenase
MSVATPPGKPARAIRNFAPFHTLLTADTERVGPSGFSPAQKESSFLLKHRFLKAGVLTASVLAGALATTASAAAPSLPTAAKGAKLELVASGVSTPTAFAFGAGNVFVSDGTLPSGGGVFVLKGTTAVRLAGSPTASFGVTWHKNTLYVSAITFTGHGAPALQLLAWSGWNGSQFTTQKVLYTAPAGFPGFNGLAFGADGRLYVGVDVGQTNDHGPATGLLYDILSFNAAGKNMRIVARGIRQPWQFAFPAGSSSPFVSNLGQDKPASIQKTVPDFILRVHKGQNYGFPKCNWIVVKACTKYATPFKFLAPHTDPGGLGIIGKRLYLSEFGFVRTAMVQSMPLRGGPLKTLLTGFKGETFIGLGTNGGWVYVGEPALTAPGTGRVFRVKP